MSARARTSNVTNSADRLPPNLADSCIPFWATLEYLDMPMADIATRFAEFLDKHAAVERIVAWLPVDTKPMKYDDAKALVKEIELLLTKSGLRWEDKHLAYESGTFLINIECRTGRYQIMANHSTAWSPHAAESKKGVSNDATL